QADGSWPHELAIELTVLRPDAGIGNILSDSGLGPGQIVDGDELPPRQATLKAIEQANGKPAIHYIEEHFTLKEDAANTRGAFEAAGTLGIALPDFLRMEGNYTFHAVARYGDCDGSRELVWTMHVDIGIDGGRTDVTVEPIEPGPNGQQCLRLTFTPRDKYGNRFGPGRAGDMNVTPRPGSTLIAAVRDLGNGSYQVDLCWDIGSTEPPGIVIGQPGRPPVSVGPSEFRLYVYSVAFVCGTQGDSCCGCAPVRPGQYATEINIHNLGDRAAPVLKRVIPLVLAGAVRGREPKVATVAVTDVIVLPPHSATMDDCCRLQELLLGSTVDGDAALTTGVLEIFSTVDLAVTAVYTTGKGGIDVREIRARTL
ncbi:MAG TPA: hypothetical protein VN089_19570, partial [Duganella sp.]|nr:hypothetical protein [Duganella sp.]